MEKIKSIENASVVSDIPDVRIDMKYLQLPLKFIIAEVSYDKKSKMILRSSDLQFHDEIKLELLEELIEKEYDFGERAIESCISVKGGGRLFLDKDRKTIWVWGISTSYGAPDYKKTTELLNVAYPDFTVTVIEDIENGSKKSWLLNLIAMGKEGEVILESKKLGINAQLVEGKTALHIAVLFGKEKVARALLTKGADITIKDENGETALDLAGKISEGMERIVKRTKQTA